MNLCMPFVLRGEGVAAATRLAAAFATGVCHLH